MIWCELKKLRQKNEFGDLISIPKSGYTTPPCCTFAPIMYKMEAAGRSKPVAIWIMIGVAMLLIQVVLGGITRLTGSGLSITEWNVVTGTLPPLNQQQWMYEFDKYRQTPQYSLLNTYFTLQDFKFIYFWEWFHRLWARLILVAFLIPFIVFLVQKRINQQMIRPLVILFLLGALQGAIGWMMVMSGLTGDAVYVKPTKLALHFVFALGLIAYAFWVGLRLIKPRRLIIRQTGLYNLTILVITLIFLQLTFGALMAGHKAALAAPTWPDINGSLIPSNLLRDRPLLVNLIENKTTIHFIHRGLAYILLILIPIWTIYAFKARGEDRTFKKRRILPLLLVMLQVLLGILTLFASSGITPNYWGSFEWLALSHQVVGMCLLLSMVGMLYFLSRKNRTQQL